MRTPFLLMLIWQPTSVFFPGEFHEQRTLAGYKQSDMTEWLSLSAWQHAQSKRPHFPDSLAIKGWPSLSLFTFMHWRRKWQPTPVFLPGESQGGEPGGLPSMGLHRVGHDWSDLAAAAAAAYYKVVASERKVEAVAWDFQKGFSKDRQ